MRLRTFAAFVAATVVTASSAGAQTDSLSGDLSRSVAQVLAADQPSVQADDLFTSAESTAAGRRSSPSLFTTIGQDFRTFFTTPSTMRTLGMVGAGALVAAEFDRPVAHSAQAEWDRRTFDAGSVAGNFFTQLGIAGGTYLLGRTTGHDQIAVLGRDLLRAQILSQGTVQAAKFATTRTRPDGSNNHSLPSGHTASAFATASVLQRHFGWKAGIPAYALAGYVGASRMADNRHYLSDVVLGAGIGIAAAHTVTMHIGEQRFSVGVSPTQGGAAVMFTKR